MSVLENDILEYSESYYKRVTINFNPQSKEYFYIRFIGFIQKYLNVVVFKDFQTNVYYVYPDYDSSRETPASEIGKTQPVDKDPVCRDVLDKIRKELEGESETMRLFASDFLKGAPLGKVSEEILGHGFEKRVY